jgi:beta-phosphoglucomutase-like phosphatase (HAD superfamily)
MRAVVFDLDGTLMDSLTLVLAAITHAIEPFGGRPTMDIFARLGGPPERFMGALVKQPEDVPTAVARMEDYHRANGHLIRPY